MQIQNITSPMDSMNSKWRSSDGEGIAVTSARGEYNPIARDEYNPTLQPEQVDTHQPSVAQLENAVHNLNQTMEANSCSLAFSIDPDTEHTVVKLLDTMTGEVIKQIPSKEAIAIAKAIGEVQQGLLIKQDA